MASRLVGRFVRPPAFALHRMVPGENECDVESPLARGRLPAPRLPGCHSRESASNGWDRWWSARQSRVPRPYFSPTRYLQPSGPTCAE
jgi:hypothetical protein